MRTLRHRKDKWLAWGQLTCTRWNWGLNLGSLAPEEPMPVATLVTTAFFPFSVTSSHTGFLACFNIPDTFLPQDLCTCSSHWLKNSPSYLLSYALVSSGLCSNVTTLSKVAHSDTYLPQHTPPALLYIYWCIYLLPVPHTEMWTPKKQGFLSLLSPAPL